MLSLPDGRIYAFAPEDDCQALILAKLSTAQHEIYCMMYALTLVPAVNLLLAAHGAGRDVRLILDLSQAGKTQPAVSLALEEVALGGSPEATQIARLRSAGVPLVIGNSTYGSLIHSKLWVLDGAAVLWGSYNASLAAARQDNELCYDPTPAVTTAFRDRFLAEWARLGGKEAGG